MWNSAGTKGYVAGMGSMNLVVINSNSARAGLTDTIWVGKGPTGLALDEARGQLYVLNKFDASISIVDLATEAQVDVVPFFDPSPYAIKVGRIHLYDTHKTSGLGQIACIVPYRLKDGPAGLGTLETPPPTARPDGNNLGQGLIGLEPNTTPVPFEPFHPMKGPMTTQTLQDIIGKEPLHWRGDRAAWRTSRKHSSRCREACGLSRTRRCSSSRTSSRRFTSRPTPTATSTTRSPRACRCPAGCGRAGLATPDSRFPTATRASLADFTAPRRGTSTSAPSRA